MQLPLRGATIE